MATGTSVSLEEYLHTSYRPDCDYVDGEVQKRNLGEFQHASVQTEIAIFLRERYPHLKRRVLTALRVRVKPTRVRIPDVCVLSEAAPRERVITVPPVLCVEILSPEDRMARYLDRLNDYFDMGVPVCWLLDPVLRRGFAATRGRMDEPTNGILRGGDIELPLAEVLERALG